MESKSKDNPTSQSYFKFYLLTIVLPPLIAFVILHLLYNHPYQQVSSIECASWLSGPSTLWNFTRCFMILLNLIGIITVLVSLIWKNSRLSLFDISSYWSIEVAITTLYSSLDRESHYYVTYYLALIWSWLSLSGS